MEGKTLYLPTAHNDTVWAFVGSPWDLLALWLLFINLITFLIFGLDKWKARRKVHREGVRRVPERTLFLLAIAGGSLGALLGMKIFHHKTLHRTFCIGIPIILAAQILVLLWCLFRGLFLS